MNIDTIAKNYLLSTAPEERNNWFALAKSTFQGADFSALSPRQILKWLGVSYLGAVNSSQKMEKGKKENFDSFVLYLAPSHASGINVCRHASAGCIAACLNLSGHALLALRGKGKANPIAVSRLKKTWLVAFARETAERVLSWEITRAKTKSEKAGHRFCVRLNGTSDVFWGSMFKKFPGVQFYDYTKNPLFLKLAPSFPNWHVTFSYSGENTPDVLAALQSGVNVAVPVVGKDTVARLIAEGRGFSMDKTDLRFLDEERGGFGLLTVKETPGTSEGIARGFLLDEKGFLALRAMAGKGGAA